MKMGQPPIRTLIVDDEPIARQVLRDELHSVADVEVVGEAAQRRRCPGPNRASQARPCAAGSPDARAGRFRRDPTLAARGAAHRDHRHRVRPACHPRVRRRRARLSAQARQPGAAGKSSGPGTGAARQVAGCRRIAGALERDPGAAARRSAEPQGGGTRRRGVLPARYRRCSGVPGRAGDRVDHYRQAAIYGHTAAAQYRRPPEGLGIPARPSQRAGQCESRPAK